MVTLLSINFTWIKNGSKDSSDEGLRNSDYKFKSGRDLFSMMEVEDGTRIESRPSKSVSTTVPPCTFSPPTTPTRRTS